MDALARLRRFDDPSGYVVTGQRPGNAENHFRLPGNCYETSLGRNDKPNAKLTLRPELRYDWYSGQSGLIAPDLPGNPPNQPDDDSR